MDLTDRTPPPRKTRSLALLFSVVLMDMIGFGFIIPLLPDFVDRFGGSLGLVGLLVSVYALGQVVAAPVVGRLSDRFGRKPLLLVSIGGTFLSLLLLGSSSALWVVFAARLLDGLTGGNITVAQSYVADVTTDENRARGLGLIGMAFGFGFILGPLFGGVLAREGLAVPAFVAAGIAAVNLLLIAIVLPESHPPEQRRTSIGRIRILGDIGAGLRHPETGRLLHVLVFFSFSFVMFQSLFAVHATVRLGLDTTTRALVLTYVGFLAALVQGGLVGVLARRFDEGQVLCWGLIVLAPSLLAWAFAPSLAVLLVVLVPLAVSAGVTGVLIQSALTRAAGTERTGTVLGVAASLEGINRVVAPAVGGALIATVGAWGPGTLGAILVGWTAWFVVRRLRPHVETPVDRGPTGPPP